MIFSIEPAHIAQLTDADLRTLVGLLAEQEVLRHTATTFGVTFGGHQDAKDGGIDVRVALKGGEISGFVPRPQTGFQVKAQSMRPAQIKSEMRPNGQLRTAIAELGKSGGAYIIVSSGEDPTDTALSHRRNAMAAAIADVDEAAGLHLDFYGQQQIASWVNLHVGLMIWVRSRIGKSQFGWRPFGDWSNSPGPTSEAFLVDEDVRIEKVPSAKGEKISLLEGLKRIRRTLSEPQGAVRMVGLSGLGKTRIAQAIFDASLGDHSLNPQLAIYTDLSDAPSPQPLELLSSLQGHRGRCVMIVDNCGAELHQKLCAWIRANDSQASLLTIEYDVTDDQLEHTEFWRLEPASEPIIQKVLSRRHPNLSAPDRDAIAEFADGNFRIALALAEATASGGSLANLKANDIFRRLFWQNHTENAALLRAAQACALVYSFDGELLNGEGAELPVLARLAGQTVEELYVHIAELRRRQLAQTRSEWRAVLPHALANRLASQALQDLPMPVLSEQFIASAPERLIRSFSRRLGYLHESDRAKEIVTDWLAPGGYLSPLENLNEFGLALLRNIAPVCPDTVLKAISEAADRDANFFSASASHRRCMIGLLRSIAYEASHFEAAVSLLRRFARNAPKTNDSSEAEGVFSSLFHLCLSGTHAPAPERLRALETIASSSDAEDHRLTGIGLEAMLKCDHFSSGYNFEFGARKRDFGYQPVTQHDFLDWYRASLAFALELSKKPEFREMIRRLIASHFRRLVRYVGLAEELSRIADQFAADGGWPQGWASARSAAREAKKAGHEGEFKILNSLAKRLEPRSLSDRIACYVAVEQWTAVDVLEIDLEDEVPYEKSRALVEQKCREIGGELARDIRAFENNLAAILSSRTNRGSHVALEMGRQIENPAPVLTIIERELIARECDATIVSFSSMFFGGLAEHQRTHVDEFLDLTLKDVRLHPAYVYLESAIELSTRGLERLKSAIGMKSLPINSFQHLSYSRPLSTVSGADLYDLLLAISVRESGLPVSLDILHARVFRKNADKQELCADERRAGRELICKITFDERRDRDDHQLARLISACLSPLQDDDVGRHVCQQLRKAIKNSLVYAGNFGQTVAALATSFPRAVLDILVEESEFGHEDAREIFTRFREERSCPLQNINLDVMLDWARTNPELRYARLAKVIRLWRAEGDDGRELSDSDEKGELFWTTQALRLLQEAPEPLVAFSIFIKRFEPSMWSGSLADLLERRARLLTALPPDTDPSILKTAIKEHSRLLKLIERVRKHESEDRRQRDQRFE